MSCSGVCVNDCYTHSDDQVLWIARLDILVLWSLTETYLTAVFRHLRSVEQMCDDREGSSAIFYHGNPWDV